MVISFGTGGRLWEKKEEATAPSYIDICINLPSESSQKMECAELLSHVQRAESMLPVSSDAYFGHPPPPEIHVMQLPSTEKVYLGAAVSKRCISAQLWGEHVSEAQPSEILCLATPEAKTDDQEEEITCATVLALDPAIKGSGSTIYATIVVGTNFSRVISMEVQIEKDEKRTFSFHQNLPPFEPMPLDSPGEEVAGDDASIHSMTSDVSSRHGRRGLNDSLRNSQHGTTHNKDSCGCSGPTTKNDGSNKHEGISHKFRPSGRVTSVTPYRISLNDDEYLTPVVWVAYGDGTTVRTHHSAFFSSVVHDRRFRDALAKAVLRSRVLLPPSVEGITVVPLPKHHPSPLAPLPPWKPHRYENDAMDSPTSTPFASDDDEGLHEDEEEIVDIVPEFHEALVYGGDPKTGTSEQFPALAFYTSENQFVGRVTGEDLRGRSTSSDQDAALLDHVIGGATALVSGVFGPALGVVKWSLGKGDKVCICMMSKDYSFATLQNDLTPLQCKVSGRQKEKASARRC